MSLKDALNKDMLNVGLGTGIVVGSFYYLLFPIMDLVGFNPNVYQVTFYYSMFFLLIVAGITLVLHGLGDKVNFSFLPVDMSVVSDNRVEFQFYMVSLLLVILLKYTYLSYMVGGGIMYEGFGILLATYGLVHYFKKVMEKYKEE